ncbi:MAG TPA: hypothetical protein VG738_15040 [Chitinophagaceae bacterium]|nr:hypothetical protein [Chitinophagaceae bacterium]
MGRSDAKAHKIEIDNEILTQFFQSDLRLSNVPANDFVDNLILFFKKEAIFLSGGDMSKIYELEKFDLERAQTYTTDLLIKQQLPSIDIAWKNKNYKAFVDLVNQVDKRKLPPSYSMKLKIAAEKVR